jgi:hypothetical protein
MSTAFFFRELRGKVAFEKVMESLDPSWATSHLPESNSDVKKYFSAALKRAVSFRYPIKEAKQKKVLYLRVFLVFDQVFSDFVGRTFLLAKALENSEKHEFILLEVSLSK